MDRNKSRSIRVLGLVRLLPSQSLHHILKIEEFYHLFSLYYSNEFLIIS